MSKYKGLFTFDIDNHRYIPIGQADGIVVVNDADCATAEPLIKDEKVRKAVRAWAEVNCYTKLWVYHDHTTISFYNEDDGDNEITFNTMEKFSLENLKCYTIAELCGEEG